jgi:cytochrome c-type biogenesis protein CcmH
MLDRLIPRLALLAAAVLALAGAPALAKEAENVAANPALEARVMLIATELRCLVCQNQTIADSHADLAVDLRNQIRDMIGRGQSDEQILRYMTERYGDFVLYKPPLKPTTWLLWAGPVLLLVGAMGGLFFALRRRQRASADDFDPETPDDASQDSSSR